MIGLVGSDRPLRAVLSPTATPLAIAFGVMATILNET